jgi:hypothetical protein
MQCVDTIWQDFVEPFPFHSKGVPIQPQDMIRVDAPYRLFDAIVKRWQSDVLWVAWLVQRIVASHQFIVSVSCRNLLPKPHRTILMVFKVPEGGTASRVI